ncbi:MAG: site-2 protease family protein [Nitrospirae bacterium]|nr:site-2 protease family protein [Nitrospirota bacterium]
MDISQLMQNISIMALPILFAITLHEAAHGWMADRLGDPTARHLGRLTLNPIAHIDMIGTILIPLFMLYYAIKTGNWFIFGYAKPVPVNSMNFKNPKKDMAIVAVAGPVINIILAIISGIILHIIIFLIPMININNQAGSILTTILVPVALMLKWSVRLNVLLAVFNMIPIPPLDGGRVIVGILPEHLSEPVSRIEPYGIFILMGLLFLDPFHTLSRIMWPVISLLTNIILGIWPM